MARPKKNLGSIAATAVLDAPAPPVTPVAPVSEKTANKRKGKAPSEKTLLVRAGIIKHPNLPPKKLVEVLNEAHPGFTFKNHDVSQQKLQMRALNQKTGQKKGLKTTAVKASSIEPEVKGTPAKAGADIKHLADLAKHLGTAKIREVCDLIDLLAN